MATGALHFDGTGQVTFTGLPPNSSSDSHSYSAWIRPVSKTATEVVISATGSIGSEGTSLGIFLFPGLSIFRLVFFHNGVGNRSFFDADSSLLDGNYHHIASSYDAATNKAKVFFDGALIGTTGTLSSFTTTDDMRFGADDPNSIPYEGDLDEVGIYNIALDAAAITALFNNGAGVCGSASAPGILFGYHLDEAAAGPFLSYATANNGTPSGGVTSVAGHVICGGGPAVATLSGMFFGST